MYISSRPPHRDPLRLTRRHWLAGAASGASLFLILGFSAARGPSTPQLHIVPTGDSLSALLRDGQYNILFMNAQSPMEARSSLGILRRPWEPSISVIVTDAQDRIARGIWEVLQRSKPEQLIVLGAPGDSDDWARIERFCRDERIEIRYLERATKIRLTATNLTLTPGDISRRGQSATFVEFSTSEMRILLQMGGTPQTGRYHAAVATSSIPEGLSSDLFIRTSTLPIRRSGSRTLLANPGRRLTIALEPARLRVRGGTLEVKPDGN